LSDILLLVICDTFQKKQFDFLHYFPRIISIYVF